jgi:hypothetical protein
LIRDRSCSRCNRIASSGHRASANDQLALGVLRGLLGQRGRGLFVAFVLLFLLLVGGLLQLLLGDLVGHRIRGRLLALLLSLRLRLLGTLLLHQRNGAQIGRVK